MATRHPTNADMLGWFDASERQLCGACGQTAAVSAGHGSAAICLVCGAIWASDGERLDVNQRPALA